VAVEVIRRKVGDHGNVGALAQGLELKAAELQYDPVVRGEVVHLLDQGRTDVAAHGCRATPRR
jgi:hypothetical protein